MWIEPGARQNLDADALGLDLVHPIVSSQQDVCLRPRGTRLPGPRQSFPRMVEDDMRQFMGQRRRQFVVLASGQLGHASRHRASAVRQAPDVWLVAGDDDRLGAPDRSRLMQGRRHGPQPGGNPGQLLYRVGIMIQTRRQHRQPGALARLGKRLRRDVLRRDLEHRAGIGRRPSGTNARRCRASAQDKSDNQRIGKCAHQRNRLPGCAAGANRI